MKTSAEKILKYIKNSPTAFHAVDTLKKELIKNDYIELNENEKWKLESGKSYFTIRNNTSIIAFSIGENLERYNFNIAASHTDSPTFKLKENAQITIDDKYTKLNTEGYGGMICSTWFDRPLSIAGRVIIKKENKLETKLINFDRDLVMIPNLAIHMNRNVNDGYSYNKQIDLLPLLSGKKEKDNIINEMIAKEISINVNEIYGSDLFLYNRMEPTIWGLNDEFISAPQLDDLQCVFSGLEALINSKPKESINVIACFDNEEVGSQTKQGAGSTLLYDILLRINQGLGKSIEDFYCALASSFMVSCDNAHAVHPNHISKTDETNNAYMNQGIVIKSHAGQKYTSDGLSIALFKTYCEKANVPYQFFANRSDMIGGSTLGNIAMNQISINSVDIGLAQLAMHSTYETAGVKDIKYLIDVLTMFFNSSIKQNNINELIIHE